MVRPLAALRTATRALHTTSVRSEQSSREITSDFLARLMKQSPSSKAASGSSSPHDAARSMINSLGMAEREDEGRQSFTTKKILSPDAFHNSSLYPSQKQKWTKPPLLGPNKKIAKRIDPFHIRGQDPVDHATNPLMCFEFLDATGRIKKRAETGLTWKSQRRMGKMIRRARAMGVISMWSNKPRPGGLGANDYGAYWRRGL